MSAGGFWSELLDACFIQTVGAPLLAGFEKRTPEKYAPWDGNCATHSGDSEKLMVSAAS
jgi:hypothetical protein